MPDWTYGYGNTPAPGEQPAAPPAVGAGGAGGGAPAEVNAMGRRVVPGWGEGSDMTPAERGLDPDWYRSPAPIPSAEPMPQQGQPAIQAPPPPAPPPPAGPMRQRVPPLPDELQPLAGGQYYAPDYLNRLHAAHAAGEITTDQYSRGLDQWEQQQRSGFGIETRIAREQGDMAQEQGRYAQDAMRTAADFDQRRAGLMAAQRSREQELEQEHQARRQRLQADYQAGKDQYTAAVDAVNAGEIDPNRIWKQGGAGMKFLGALAIAVGDLGKNMMAFGGIQSENTALKLIGKAVDDDIAAQRDNLANKRAGLDAKRGLLGFMREKIDDEDMADAAAKAQMYRSMQSYVDQMGLTMESKLKKQRLQQLGSELEHAASLQEKQIELVAAQRAEAIEAARQQAAAAAAQAMAERQRKMQQLMGWRPLDKDEAKNIIPGFGVAAPTTGETAISKLRDEAAKVDTYNQNLDRVVQIAKKGGTWATLSPQEKDEVQQLYFTVFNTEVKELSGAAVSESEMARYQKQFGRDPSSTWDNVASSVPKSVERFKDQLNRGFRNKLKRYGVSGQVEKLPDPDSGSWRWHVKDAPEEQQGGGAKLYDTE